MPSPLDLVVLNGPRENEVVPLDPSRLLRLGRSAKGFQLVDPLVSLIHAEIQWEGDRFWIEDSGSATGTFVNEVRVMDKAVGLEPGMKIRLGETEIEVRTRPRSTLLRTVGLIAGIGLVAAAGLTVINNIEVVYEPRIMWFEPVHQGGGVTDPLVEVPITFIRETGVDHRNLKVEQVSDFDGDGVDEMWLSWSQGRRLVTFTPDGSWRTVADIPPTCRRGRLSLDGLDPVCADALAVGKPLPEGCDRITGGGFPPLECGGVTYQFRDGTYLPSALEGLLAWMPPTIEKEGPTVGKGKNKVTIMLREEVEGPPRAWVFSKVKTATLGGFLAERGVTEPIHYIVCENAFPGVRAQVLTASGRLEPLSLGCIGGIELFGAQRSAEFGTTFPRMIALTGVGREALMADVSTWMSGDPDGLFMSPRDRRSLTVMRDPPTPRVGGVAVQFEGPELPGDYIAAEQPVPGVRRWLLTEFAEVRPGPADSQVLAGSTTVDVPGCGAVEVSMGPWHCLKAKGCLSSSQFLTVRNTGCGTGRPMPVPYAPGEHPFRDGRLAGKVLVDAIDGPQLDVLRVRLAWREPAPAE